MKAITPAMARCFAASVWFDTAGLSKRERVYAKCRELVSGDRAEILAVTGDTRYFEHRMTRGEEK